MRRRRRRRRNRRNSRTADSLHIRQTRARSITHTANESSIKAASILSANTDLQWRWAANTATQLALNNQQPYRSANERRRGPRMQECGADHTDPPAYRAFSSTYNPRRDCRIRLGLNKHVARISEVQPSGSRPLSVNSACLPPRRANIRRRGKQLAPTAAQRAVSTDSGAARWRTRTHTDAHGRTRTHTDAHGRTRTHTDAHGRARLEPFAENHANFGSF